jgi:hypothetical protein
MFGGRASAEHQSDASTNIDWINPSSTARWPPNTS